MPWLINITANRSTSGPLLRKVCVSNAEARDGVVLSLTNLCANDAAISINAMARPQKRVASQALGKVLRRSTTDSVPLATSVEAVVTPGLYSVKCGPTCEVQIDVWVAPAPTIVSTVVDGLSTPATWCECAPWYSAGRALQEPGDDEDCTMKLNGCEVDAALCFTMAVRLGPQFHCHWFRLAEELVVADPPRDMVTVHGARFTWKECIAEAISRCPESRVYWSFVARE